MQENRFKAYQTVAKETMPGRQLEASVLLRGAIMLAECRENWNTEDRDERLSDALHFNQRIWSFFQAELARADHPLPQSLRGDLLNLSAFIDKRIFEVMAYPAPEKLTAIIDINRNLAAGLGTLQTLRR